MTSFLNLADLDESHLPLMRIVERVVRPLPANMARKRRIRDEMLTHLSAIYDEELTRSGDPAEAMDAASKKFGSPIELTAELQATVPKLEQWEMRLDRAFGWRPPETATRWMLRISSQLALVMLLTCLLAAAVAFSEFGWSYSVWLTVRPNAAAALILPICLFSYGVCYYKIRDHYFGVFGAKKSWFRVVAWAALLNLATVASGFIFFLISYGSLAPASAAFYPIVVFGIIWAAGAIVITPVFGRQEIRDTVWALLDLEDSPIAAD